ncbi:carbohydrate kinase [bacterium]|nr:carbohydrate kinase [bacterium]
MPTDERHPIIFGEVLFDVYPDGTEILGGAPFNVAWHLQAFGAKPLMVSRVGADERGERIRRRMENWGMITDGIGLDPKNATGIVQVSYDDNHQPHYDIIPEQAFDFIDGGKSVRLLNRYSPSLLYHGTLAVRTESARYALAQWRDTAEYPVFIDVNLREPWWELAAVRGLLSAGTWIKLNADELFRLETGNPTVEDALKDFAGKFPADFVVVTEGDKGAFARRQGENIRPENPPPTVEVIDTVGAGDAFASVMILGILNGWPLPTSLTRAGKFAAEVCRRKGATSDDRELYAPFLAEWNLD